MSDYNSTQSVIIPDCFSLPSMKPVTISCVVVKTTLMVPLSAWVLYLGYRQRQRSLQKTVSHSDFFTYHMAVLELVGCVGFYMCLGGNIAGIKHIEKGGVLLSSVIFPGELFVHCITCADRYLAVVHPIFYLELRQKKGIVARNVSAAVVWILSLSSVGLVYLYYPRVPVFEYIILLAASLVVMLFCSAAVLRALIRPGPGDTHSNRDKTDQSKLRAFKIIAAISLAQLVWLLGFLICLCLEKGAAMSREKECLVLVSVIWFNIPCSLALPVLFLQRKRSKS